ncbi:MAG: hypothetical protein ABJB03_06040 [Rhodoglobus sp.]
MKALHQSRATLPALLAIVAVLLAGCAVGTATPTPIAPDTPVLVVNDQAVPARELRIFLLSERSNVVSGTTSQLPKDANAAIFAAAEADATAAAVQFQLASEAGLIADPTYSTFVTSLAAENQRRRDAMAQNDPIYGPQQFSESNYLDYVLGDIRYKLPQLLAESGQIDATQHTIDDYYAAHQDEFVGHDGSQLAVDSEQVRLAYLDDRYEELVASLSKAASVSSAGDGKRMLDSGCALEGSC